MLTFAASWIVAKLLAVDSDQDRVADSAQRHQGGPVDPLSPDHRLSGTGRRPPGIAANFHPSQRRRQDGGHAGSAGALRVTLLALWQAGQEDPPSAPAPDRAIGETDILILAGHIDRLRELRTDEMRSRMDSLPPTQYLHQMCGWKSKCANPSAGNLCHQHPFGMAMHGGPHLQYFGVTTGCQPHEGRV